MPTVTRTAEACLPASLPVLFEREKDIRADLPWFALFIRQRDRERCEAYLHAHSYDLFSPVRAEMRQWSDRKSIAQVPLFPGYIFCRFDPCMSAPIVRAPGLIEIVSSGNHYLDVDATQIENVRRCVETGSELEVTPEFVHGQKVRIKSGPLSGITGVLTTARHKLRIALEISMMNRTLLVEVESSDICQL